MSDFYDEDNHHPDLIKDIIKEAKRRDKTSLEGVLNVMKSIGKKQKKKTCAFTTKHIEKYIIRALKFCCIRNTPCRD